ncbi:MAG: zinc ribbon domain-containing protein [Burkholderiales bacterium]|nr:zinc ribbon domain-containing protein [Burkholderiales bacterium]
MSLVIKSWSVQTTPAAGQPHIRIVGRASGFMSFVLSTLGIDATTTLIVDSRHVEYESGSLAGFSRTIVPLEHISSTSYGQYKPWGKSLFILIIGIMLGGAIMGSSTASTIVGTLISLGAIALAGAYYMLNKSLSFGFREHGVKTVQDIQFKRSVIEGQEVNEQALRNMITLIEYLINPQGLTAPSFSLGGRPAAERMAEPAPTSLQKAAATVSPPKCPACQVPITGDEVFCGSCGHKLK